MDVSQYNNTSLAQNDQHTVTSRAQQFREEQLCALQTLGDWQQDGYKTYSSYSFSSFDETFISTANSVASSVDASIAAAIVHKKRVLLWQEERSQPRKDGAETLEKTQEPFSLFKVPLPKPAVLRVELHNWYFGLRSRNWVLVGKIINDEGIKKKYTSRSLLQYFERTKARKISSVDQTKFLILFGPCCLDIYSVGQLHHPNFIKETFRHGFPKNWKNILSAWSDFNHKGQPQDFIWPVCNTSLNSSSTTMCSYFTSVTDRPVQNEPLTNFKIPRNIGVEEDSRYALNRFLGARETEQNCLSYVTESSGPGRRNQLLNSAELSIHTPSKTLAHVEIADSAAHNKFPNVSSSKCVVENALHASRAPAKHSLKDDRLESQENYDGLEPRKLLGTSTSQHLDVSNKKVRASVANRTQSSSSKRHDEQTFLKQQSTPRNSLKKDCLESQNHDDRSEPRKLVESSTSRNLDASNANGQRRISNKGHDEKTFKKKSTERRSSKKDHRKSGNNGEDPEPRKLVGNSIQSSSSEGHDEQSFPKQQSTERHSLKKYSLNSGKNGEGPEPRKVVETSTSKHLDASDARAVSSKVASRSKHSFWEQLVKQTSKQPGTASHCSKKIHVESRKNDDLGEARERKGTTLSHHLDASDARVVSSNVANRSKSNPGKTQFKRILHTPTEATSNSSKENHSKFQRQDEGGPRIHPLENNSKSDNQSQPLTTYNKPFEVLCGKAIDLKCTVEKCLCSMFSNRVMVLELTRIDATGSTEKETAKNRGKLINKYQAASNSSIPTIKFGHVNFYPSKQRSLQSANVAYFKSIQSGSVLALKRWRPVLSGTNNELLLAGDIVDSAGNVEQHDHVSCPVVLKRKGYFQTSDGNKYTVVGKLSSEAKRGIPRAIASHYFKNNEFPTHWKKMVSEWNENNEFKKNAYSLKKRIPATVGLRASTRERKQPIQYWKACDNSRLSDSSSLVDQLSNDQINHKKSKHTSKKVLRTLSGKATKHKEAKCPKAQLHSQNCCRSPSDNESYLDRTQKGSRKSTRLSRKITLEKESDHSPRLKKSCRMETQSNSANNQDLRSPYAKKKCKRICYRNSLSSSEKSTASNNSGNERPKRASKEKMDDLSINCLNGNPCHKWKSRSSGHLKQKLSRSDAQSCVAAVEDASGVQQLQSDKVASRPSTHLRSDLKAVTYPWMSDADTSMDSDSDIPGIQSPIRLQQSDSCNAEKVHQNNMKMTISCIQTNSIKQIEPTLPTPNMKGSSLGLANMSKFVILSNNKSDQNEENISFDNASLFTSIVFSETDPRAAKY